MCLCVPMCGFVLMRTGANSGQKSTLNPLELELQMAESCPTWVLDKRNTWP